MLLKRLVGSGDRIVLATAPVLLVGVVLTLAVPAVFRVGGPPVVRVLALGVLAVGVVVWLWSAVLVLRHVPRGELITTGPFAVVRHPIYTSVGLLVLPCLGLVLDTWLGVVVGLSLYAASRVFAPAEERELHRAFGVRWETYRDAVVLPWL